MIKSILVWSVALAIGAALATTSQAQDQQAPNVAEIMKQVMGAMGQGTGTSPDGKPHEPINFRELKKQLPAELTGMKRTSSSGEKTSTLGMTVSTAKAEYKGSNQDSLSLTISDIGALGGFAAMAQYAWTMSEYERESDTGFERTMTWKGHRATEEYDSKDKRGKIGIMLENKVVINIEGRGIPFETLEEARDSLDVDVLLGLQGVEKEEAAE